MPQARSFEDSALDLGRDLRAHGHRDLAAGLLEVVPETGSVRDEAHRSLVAERLDRVAAADHVAPLLRGRAAHLANLARSAAIRHGRIGTVWIAWTSGDGDGTGHPAGEPGYRASWQSDRGDGDWCEDGPYFADLRDALKWARDRTDAVVVRPSWDAGTYHWAGEGHDPRDFPPLDESRA